MIDKRKYQHYKKSHVFSSSNGISLASWGLLSGTHSGPCPMRPGTGEAAVFPARRNRPASRTAMKALAPSASRRRKQRGRGGRSPTAAVLRRAIAGSAARRADPCHQAPCPGRCRSRPISAAWLVQPVHGCKRRGHVSRNGMRVGRTATPVPRSARNRCLAQQRPGLERREHRRKPEKSTHPDRRPVKAGGGRSPTPLVLAGFGSGFQCRPSEGNSLSQEFDQGAV